MNPVSGAPVWIQAAPVAQVAVIAALELEARTLISAESAGAATIYVSGPGRERAEAAAARAVAAGARALVSWGLAGGLSAVATTGTVVIPARVIDETRSCATSDDWRRIVASSLRDEFAVSEEALVSVDAVLTDVAAKQSLASRTGAVAVDMESAGIARVAQRAGMPFLVLRVVADGPDDALPDCVAGLVTPRGSTRLVGLLRFAGAPGQLPSLFRLARNSRVARNVLERIAVSHRERAA